MNAIQLCQWLEDHAKEDSLIVIVDADTGLNLTGVSATFDSTKNQVELEADYKSVER